MVAEASVCAPDDRPGERTTVACRRRGRPKERWMRSVEPDMKAPRVEFWQDRKAGRGQITEAFLGIGLMCDHSRLGLSQIIGTGSGIS